MKTKLLIGSIAGMVVLGGIAGVSAFADSNDGDQSKYSQAKIISMEKVKEIVNKEVGGTIKSIELEEDDGRLKYEVELRGKYDDDDIEVDAITGKVYYDDWDDDYNYKSNSDASVSKKNGIITKEEAIAIALKSSPGRIVEVELDDGEYEIEIKTDKYEIEYEIDAYTGKILEKDVDWDDDDDDDDDDRYDD